MITPISFLETMMDPLVSARRWGPEARRACQYQIAQGHKACRWVEPLYSQL